MTRSDAMPADVRPHRYVQLDSLRGVAALTVVIHHFLLLWPAQYRLLDESPLRFVAAGHEAVVFFFVLSGFVLSVPYAGPRAPRYGTFLAKRMCRIYLPFAAAVLISTLGDALMGWTVKANPSGVWSAKPTPALLGHVLLTSIPAAQQVNTALWTLALEIRISLVFPVLYWVSRRYGPVVAVLGLAVICAANQVLHVLGMEVMLCVSTAMLFLLGIGLHQNLARVSALVSGLGRRGAGVLVGVGLLLLEGPGAVLAHRGTPFSPSVTALKDLVVGLGAVMLVAPALQKDRWRLRLSHPLLVRLGALSYSTYLVHISVLFVLVRLFYGKPFLVLLLPVYGVLVYASSELFRRVVDEPAVRLSRVVGRKLERPRRMLAVRGEAVPIGLDLVGGEPGAQLS